VASSDLQNTLLAAKIEMVHTTDNHLRLTVDRGLLNAGDLQIDERVLQLDGAMPGY
jgi:hypothetical protein